MTEPDFSLDQAQASSVTPHFIRGRIYDRRTEINGPFGGSWQSGIAPSAKAPAIFLFTGDNGAKYGYRDHRDELGVFHYSGEGQKGHMTFTRGNLAVRDHAMRGLALHLFKSLGKGKGQQYLGEHVCDTYDFRPDQDKNHKNRMVIVFRLVPVELVDTVASHANQHEEVNNPPSHLQELRERALAALVTNQTDDGKTALRNLYRRSNLVKDYVLMRAAGVCESCSAQAPFKRRDGSEYLEPHHVNRVSDGGLDHPSFVAAICPNCHRHIHYGAGGEAMNKALMERLAVIEPFQ